MKKIYYFLAACLLVTTFASCSFKEDEVFSEPAAERSAKNVADVKEVLAAAPNGWLMEYYGNLNMGGYNVMVKFDGDQATFASEKWGTNHKAGLDADGKCITTTSHYKFEQSMGTVLSFDEYNETFHYYSMPNNPDYSYDTADGLYGDFEFRVMKADADSVILRGKKHNNRIVMTPIPADKTWESYITEADETETFMTSRSYTLDGDDYTQKAKTITVTNNGTYRCLIFTYTDDNEQKVTVAAPYIVKADGYYFYRPVEVYGYTLDGLVKGDTDDYFVFRNNERLQLNSYLPPLTESVTTATWYLRYGSVGEYAKPYWDNMLEILKTAGKGKQEIKIYTATFGQTTDGKMASSMTTSSDAPYYGYSISTEPGTHDTRIKFTQNSSVRNSAGKTYYNKYGWDAVLKCIYGHTFDLSIDPTDNKRRPSRIFMTDVDNPTNVITLYATPSYFMEDMSYYNDR